VFQEEEEQGNPRLSGKPSSRPVPNLLSAGAHAKQESRSVEDRQLPGSYSLPVSDSQISITVIDEHSFTRECITKSLQELGKNLDVASFSTCEDYFQDTKNNNLILYHLRENITKNINGNDGKITALKRLLHTSPVIVLCAAESRESILEAFENGARGYIPTASTTLELAMEIIRLVRAGGTFVPYSSLSLRKINQNGVTAMGNQFTPRQMAVLDHLKQGKANKAIAHELQLSQSTVKVHIRNIMKKMKATNRTEVAYRADAFQESPRTRNTSDAD
jgi:DNA-binding NarL/FixJ family response regulator